MSRKKGKKRARTWGYAWWEDPPLGRKELLRRVEPLLKQIRRVDEVVAKIAEGKGRVADLVGLEQILKEPFALSDTGGTRLMLAQPAAVRSALTSVSRELHLEVHSIDGQYPSYLLCRISTDWDAPDAILEELYVSVRNDFFMDNRFVVLLRNGRSKTFLRLSPFREKLRAHLAKMGSEAPDDEACDDILETVATLVLAAAWYEDQRLPFAVADVFQLRSFRSAMELVGFVLGSDPYQAATGLRDAGEEVVDFFDQVYDSRPLACLLRRLSCRGVENLSGLEAGARDAFLELNQAFSAFLSMTGALRDLDHLELYKIVLGGFGNLHEVAGREYWTTALEQAVRTIETRATEHIQRLML